MGRHLRVSVGVVVYLWQRKSWYKESNIEGERDRESMFRLPPD